jgi:hypothetical protein
MYQCTSTVLGRSISKQGKYQGESINENPGTIRHPQIQGREDQQSTLGKYIDTFHMKRTRWGDGMAIRGLVMKPIR